MEATTPPANIYEGNGQLSVAAPIPGPHPEHGEVIATPTRHHVAATCKSAQDTHHSHRRDWRVGAWELGVDLPKQVDPAAARATLNLGVLVVMAPISETAAG